MSEHLVGSAAFKAVGTGAPRAAGSIPVHLRQRRGTSVPRPVGRPARTLPGGDPVTSTERHFFRMVLDLTTGPFAGPPLPAGSVLEPMSSESLRAYGRIVARAYAGDHVDHQPADDDPVQAAEVIRGALRGDSIGPWLADASAHIRCDDGTIVAAIVISEREPDGDADRGVTPDPSGPWINDVFVDPAAAGQRLGAGLVVHAANRLLADGRSHLRLAVTAGNPARTVYERLGFRVEEEVRRARRP